MRSRDNYCNRNTIMAVDYGAECKHIAWFSCIACTIGTHTHMHRPSWRNQPTGP